MPELHKAHEHGSAKPADLTEHRSAKTAEGVQPAASMLEFRLCVEDAVVTEVQARDQEKLLRAADFARIVQCIADMVCARMVHVQQTALDDEDRAFIRLTSTRMVNARSAHRFRKHDRVVCHVAGSRGWAAGTVIQLDRVDPDDLTGQTLLPYLVKIDPPNERIVCVPRDGNDVVRAETCYGQEADLIFTLFCKPRKQTRTRRFGVGDRVVCAVDTVTGEDLEWAAGTVTDVNYDVGPDASKVSTSWDLPSADGIVPYRVLLDTGGRILVHRDQHWLLRDLRLQPAGSCQSRSRFTSRMGGDVRLWTPQQTQFFPRQFQAAALATLCAAHRLREHPPPGVTASLGDLPPELLLGIIATSAGKERIDQQSCQVRHDYQP